MKVAFIGHPGSGKTYAATTLARAIDCKEIDIDALRDHWVYFIFRKPYRKALDRLFGNKSTWIIDGYSGKRMPAKIWNEADHIIYINLPKSELKQNVYSRYRLNRAANENRHGQKLFTNVLKNLWQIYLLDYSLKRRVRDIRNSLNAEKVLEVRSRKE